MLRGGPYVFDAVKIPLVRKFDYRLIQARCLSSLYPNTQKSVNCWNGYDTCTYFAAVQVYFNWPTLVI